MITPIFLPMDMSAAGDIPMKLILAMWITLAIPYAIGCAKNGTLNPQDFDETYLAIPSMVFIVLSGFALFAIVSLAIFVLIGGRLG